VEASADRGRFWHDRKEFVMDSARNLPPVTRCGSGATPADARDLVDVDVPMGGWWLLATLVGGPGDVFTARQMDPAGTRAFGGDVLIWLVPDGPATVRAEVWAAASGALHRVTAWDQLREGSWPETLRPVTAFAMATLTAIGEFADLGEHLPVVIGARAWDQAAGLAGFPSRVHARDGR
jgi:hypothetical protein